MNWKQRKNIHDASRDPLLQVVQDAFSSISTGKILKLQYRKTHNRRQLPVPNYVQKTALTNVADEGCDNFELGSILTSAAGFTCCTLIPQNVTVLSHHVHEPQFRFSLSHGPDYQTVVTYLREG